MGFPKEKVVLPDGRTIITYLIETLLELCSSVTIVGEVTLPPMPNVSHLPDLHPGHGPMSGMEALLANKKDTGYLVVACDQPLLTAPLLSKLLGGSTQNVRVFRPVDLNSFHPFPGYYPASIQPLVSQHVASRRYSMRELFSCIEVEFVSISAMEEELLCNVNTPVQLDELRRKLSASA